MRTPVFEDLWPSIDSNWPAQLQTIAKNKILHIALLGTTAYVLSWQWTKKAIRMCGYTGWSVPLLFAYDINRFCHDEAQMTKKSLFVNVLNLYSLSVCINPRDPLLLWTFIAIQKHLHDNVISLLSYFINNSLTGLVYMYMFLVKTCGKKYVFPH